MGVRAIVGGGVLLLSFQGMRRPRRRVLVVGALLTALSGCRRHQVEHRRAEIVEHSAGEVAASADPIGQQGSSNHADSMASRPVPGEATAAGNRAGFAPRTPLDFAERATRVQDRVNAASGAAYVLVLGESGYGAASDGGIMITVDFSLVAQVSEDAMACLYAGECARSTISQADRAMPRSDARVSAPRPAAPPAVNVVPQGIFTAPWQRDADELTGQIVARAGFRAEGFVESMTAMRTHRPRMDELAPFSSPQERQQAFMRGYLAVAVAGEGAPPAAAGPPGSPASGSRTSADDPASKSSSSAGKGEDPKESGIRP